MTIPQFIWLASIVMFFAWLVLWVIRSERDERMYDGVPKAITSRVTEINAGLIPSDMEAALSKWLEEKGEDYTLRAEALPIFHDDGYAPEWNVKVTVQGDGIDSGFDALFNRRGEILTS